MGRRVVVAVVAVLVLAAVVSLGAGAVWVATPRSPLPERFLGLADALHQAHVVVAHGAYHTVRDGIPRGGRDITVYLDRDHGVTVDEHGHPLIRTRLDERGSLTESYGGGPAEELPFGGLQYELMYVLWEVAALASELAAPLPSDDPLLRHRGPHIDSASRPGAEHVEIAIPMARVVVSFPGHPRGPGDGPPGTVPVGRPMAPTPADPPSGITPFVAIAELPWFERTWVVRLDTLVFDEPVPAHAWDARAPGRW